MLGKSLHKQAPTEFSFDQAYCPSMTVRYSSFFLVIKELMSTWLMLVLLVLVSSTIILKAELAEIWRGTY